MTMKMPNAFSFNFAEISVSDNPINDAPRNVPLPSVIKKVEYRNLAKKGSGEEKVRLVITQEVSWDDQKGRFETIISEKQGYILKSYFSAIGMDADALTNQALDEEGLSETFVGKPVSLTLEDREWQGKSYLNFKRVTKYEDSVVEDAPPF